MRSKVPFPKTLGKLSGNVLCCVGIFETVLSELAQMTKQWRCVAFQSSCGLVTAVGRLVSFSSFGLLFRWKEGCVGYLCSALPFAYSMCAF